MFRDIPIPPSPIIIGFGTWIEACDYYFKYLPAVKKIVNNFKDDGSIVENAKNSINSTKIVKDLIYINKNYEKIKNIIRKPEKSFFTIQDAIDSLSIITQNTDSAGIMDYFRKKFDENGINSILNMKNENISPKIYSQLLKCPSISISVERRFSLLRKLASKDKNIDDNNFKKYMTLYYNSYEDGK